MATRPTRYKRPFPGGTRFDNRGAAKYLGIEPETLTVGRSAGRYDIPYIKVGRKVVYLQDDLDAYIARNRVTPHGNDVAV